MLINLPSIIYIPLQQLFRDIFDSSTQLPSELKYLNKNSILDCLHEVTKQVSIISETPTTIIDIPFVNDNSYLKICSVHLHGTNFFGVSGVFTHECSNIMPNSNIYSPHYEYLYPDNDKRPYWFHIFTIALYIEKAIRSGCIYTYYANNTDIGLFINNTILREEISKYC
jgi:hypothetical protein